MYTMQKMRKKFLARGVVALMLWVMTTPSHSTPLEYQVKASYLYNFIQFITWPKDVFDRAGKFNLCVVGVERFGATLDAFTGERIEGHEIAVRRLERPAQAQTAHCHMLFIAADATDAASWDAVSERGVLTIGEAPNFLKRGGIINLVEVQGRIRFQINQRAAQEAGLVLSSRLLDLATR
ncbi:MAG: hypothetical protein Tsb0026_15420 [Sulfuricaulis sp.]